MTKSSSLADFFLERRNRRFANDLRRRRSSKTPAVDRPQYSRNGIRAVLQAAGSVDEAESPRIRGHIDRSPDR